MEVLGERAIAKSMSALGMSPSTEEKLYPAALAGDLVANATYYSMVHMAGPKAAPACGAVLGLVAGIGAVTLPGPMGLGTKPSAQTPTTEVLTVGLYLLGGVAAGLAYKYLASNGN